ncbi:MAG: helix-hairpin-helix domain-containing protein, partial [Nostocoides sp.]
TGTASVSGPASAGVGTGTPVVVDVVGQVRHPGVYTLRAGQRVADAVRAAGGVVSPSDVAAVNLARVLLDGEQIRVPRPGEAPVVGPGAGGSGGTGAADAPVNLNTADLTALDGLPGVGPVLAQRILDWRTAHGRFTSVEELGEVSGIGEKLLGQLRTKVTAP